MLHTGAPTGGSERWREISADISAEFRATMVASPIGQTVDLPDMHVARADGVAVTRAVMPALRIASEGSLSHVPTYYLTRVDRSAVLQIDSQAPFRLAAGDLVVLGSHLHYRWETARPYFTSSIHIAADLFCATVPNHQRLLGRKVASSYNCDEILGHLLDAALTMADANQFGDAGQKLVLSMLNILAALPTPAAIYERAATTALDTRCTQVKTFIRQHYSRPDLSIDDIAARLHITPRYIQLALAKSGTNPGEFLRKCRLDGASRMLRSPEHLSLSVTQIAFACGFNSSSHFSTEFRKSFGLSPREYRLAPA